MARSDREQFLETVRQALGRPSGEVVEPSPETALSRDERSVQALARKISEEAGSRADELMAELEDSATKAHWTVFRAVTPRAAATYIEELMRGLGARSVVRSTHPVLDQLELDEALSRQGVSVSRMVIEDGVEGPERERQRLVLRERAVEADVGVTGVDYAVAETGTCVLLAGRGVSRLVSLLPPVYVAVVERRQVLPSLDELFTLERHRFLQGNVGGYMSLISGPSRTADIEQTIVEGVHGPGQVHMVLLG